VTAEADIDERCVVDSFSPVYLGPRPRAAGAGIAIANPEVKLVSGTWQLFFNTYFTTEKDIYKVESNSNTSWPSSYEILIQNGGPTFCATMSPGVLLVTGTSSQYDLYYGLTPRQPDGSCILNEQKSIQRWRFQDN